MTKLVNVRDVLWKDLYYLHLYYYVSNSDDVAFEYYCD